MNLPKRNRTAYIFFCSDYRKKIQKKHPGLKPSEITKLLGKKWKTYHNKALYTQKQQEDLQRYKEEMSAYQNTVKLSTTTS